MMIPKRTQPTTNVSKNLIIILPTSYKNNVLYYFSTHVTGLITMPKKKRQEFCSKLTAQDMWDQIFLNEYHKEKIRETKRMSLYLNVCTTYSKAKIWFVSETLQFIFPKDLNEVFAIFYVKNKWDKRPRQKKAKPQEYIKLISKYKAILNRKSESTSKISSLEPVEQMAELLKLVMI